MLKHLQAFFGRSAGGEALASRLSRENAPEEVHLDGLPAFQIRRHLVIHNGYPIVDADALWRWVDALDEARKADAWGECERAWLLHLREAMGKSFHLDEARTAALVSSLDPRPAKITLEFMERTLSRVLRVLDGVASASGWGKDLLVVFDNEDQYYEYVSFYYPDRGEFGFSSGMYLGRGIGHFVTTKDDLRSIEPVIAHEMTHACLSHLPIPLWLNEGLAVNTEARLVRAPYRHVTPEQMHEKHLRFWNDAEIQQFWSGRSFGRPDEAKELSYDLARIMVEQLAKDWESFKRFVNAANYEDSGEVAAREFLGAGVAEIAAALLERDPEPWKPDPAQWETASPKVVMSRDMPRTSSIG